MFTEAKLFQILDSAMKDISKRVARCEVRNRPNVEEILAARPCSIYTTTQGDYELTFVISADCEVMKDLVRNMRHGTETGEDELPVYMQEFVNILCGHIVSNMNRKEHLKAYFDIPSFIYGTYKHPSGKKLKFNGQYYYDSPYGLVELKAYYNN